MGRILEPVAEDDAPAQAASCHGAFSRDESLTYMSITSILDELVSLKRLHKLNLVLDDDEGVYRDIYMRDEVRNFIEPGRRATRKAKNEAIDAKRFLKGFIIGDDFDNPEKLKNLDVDDLARSDRGLYSFRLKRQPQRRILGGFCESNVFVGTHVYLRDELPEAEWSDEKNEIERVWRTAFKFVGKAAGRDVGIALPLVVGRSRTDLTSNVRPGS